MKNLFLKTACSLLLCACTTCLFSQYSTEWSTTIGGSDPDLIFDIYYTADGSILAAGKSYSSDHGVEGYHDRSDAWLTKVNGAGEIIWSRCYGSFDDDGFNDVIESADGNYLALGFIHDASGDVSIHYGSADLWLIKTDTSGDLIWEHSYGNSSVDYATRILETGDGNYYLIGVSTMSGPDMELFDFQDQFLIIKIDPDGNVIWQKNYGGTSFEEPKSAVVDADTNLVMVGFAKSDDGDVIGHTYFGDADAWFLKIDQEGNILASVCYGSLNYEFYEDITTYGEDNFLALSGNLTEDASCGEPPVYDFQISSINTDGIIEWQKCFGAEGYDWGDRLVKDVDGYFIAGTTLSESLPGFHGFDEYDFYAAKLNNAGDVIWQYCYGGSGLEGNGIDLAADNMGGFLIGGTSESIDGDNVTPFGSNDGLIIKVTCEGSAEIFSSDSLFLCTDDSVQLFTPYISGATWQWIKDGEEIPLANDTILYCLFPGDYQVEVKSLSGCIKRSAVLSVVDTCVPEYDMRIPYAIYPNPAVNNFTIECIDNDICNVYYDIFIYNMNGKIVKEIRGQKAGTSNNFMLSLKQGLYILSINEIGGKQYRQPVIITY